MPTSLGSATSQPTGWGYLKDMLAWIHNPATFLFGRWEGHPEGGFEGGVDIGSAGGTPVYALATGPLQGAGYFCHGGPFFNQSPSCANNAPGYGVVTQRINVPGYGTQDLYYQHIDIDPSLTLCASGNCGSQMVQKGQKIGTIRPGINMLELGFNADWGTIWGTNHPAAWVDDPRPLLKALIQDTSPSIAPVDGSGGSNALDPIGSFWASAQPTLKAWGEYIAVFLIAVTLVVIGFFLLDEGAATQAAAIVGKAVAS